MKTELEEAAEKYVNIKHKPSSGIPNKGIQNFYDCRNAFKDGAKWQMDKQERSYSEEEVKQAYTEGGFAQLRYIDGLPYIDRDKWFEQFKNK